MKKADPKEQIVEEFEKSSEEILQKMLMLLIRAQRKIDDAMYRKILNSLQT